MVVDRKTVLLHGTGRSGTTWLGRVLAWPFRYRLVWEPFQSDFVREADCVTDRYISPDNVPDEVVHFVERAVNDRVDHEWPRRHSSRFLGLHRWQWWPKVRICKDVRSNLAIPALRALLGPRVPIVLVMRHPGAVVESFLRVRFAWAFNVERLLQQHELQAVYGVPLDRLRPFADGPVGCLAVRWVIENAYLMRCANDLGVHLVHYEDLLADPEANIRKLCRLVGIKPARNLAEVVAQPSHMTHSASPLRDGLDPATAWRQRLPEDDIRLVERVLEEAEVRYPGSASG